MPAARVPQETIERLNNLNSAYGFAWSGPPKAKRGEECKCWVIDKATGRPYAAASAADELSALHAALERAQGAEKPLTPAEQATQLRLVSEERDALKRRVEALEAQGAATVTAPPPPPTAAPAPAPPPAEPTPPATVELPVVAAPEPPPVAPPPTAAETEASQAADASAAKLVEELQARKLSVPDGDMRTAAWRRAAMDAIEADEDLTTEEGGPNAPASQ